MKYTTYDSITRKLRGRLKIAENSEIPIFNIDSPGQLVDNTTIELVVEENEAFIDLIIGEIYNLPLSLSNTTTQHIMRDITDNLSMEELMQIHYQGSGGFAGLSGDISQFGNGMRTKGLQTLYALTVGLNIYIPGLPPIAEFPGSRVPRRIQLPGESEKTIEPQRKLVFNDIVVEKHEVDELPYDYFLDSDPHNPFSNERLTGVTQTDIEDL